MIPTGRYAAAGRVLADHARDRFFQNVNFPLADQKVGQLPAKLRLDAIQRVADGFLPLLRARGLKRFQRATVFRSGQLFHEWAKLEILRPNCL